MSWSVYILQCSDGTLYTGATNDLKRRVAAHNAGKGAKYTRGRLPVKLVAAVHGLAREWALHYESRVKEQARKNKIEFLKSLKFS